MSALRTLVLEAIASGSLPGDALAGVGGLAIELVAEQGRRERLLQDAEDDCRSHSARLAQTGTAGESFWRALRDVTERRADLLRTAEQLNLVRAELESLLARAHVTRSRTLSPTHNQE